MKVKITEWKFLIYLIVISVMLISILFIPLKIKGSNFFKDSLRVKISDSKINNHAKDSIKKIPIEIEKLNTENNSDSSSSISSSKFLIINKSNTPIDANCHIRVSSDGINFLDILGYKIQFKNDFDILNLPVQKSVLYVKVENVMLESITINNQKSGKATEVFLKNVPIWARSIYLEQEGMQFIGGIEISDKAEDENSIDMGYFNPCRNYR